MDNLTGMKAEAGGLMLGHPRELNPCGTGVAGEEGAALCTGRPGLVCTYPIPGHHMCTLLLPWVLNLGGTFLFSCFSQVSQGHPRSLLTYAAGGLNTDTPGAREVTSFLPSPGQCLRNPNPEFGKEAGQSLKWKCRSPASMWWGS